MNSFKKKFLFGIFLSALAFWLGHETRKSDLIHFEAHKTSAPESHDARLAEKREPIESSKSQETAEQPAGLANTNPGEIDFNSLIARFSAPYPQSPSDTEAAHHDHRQKNEVVDRLRILRELLTAQGKTTEIGVIKKFTALYSVVLSNSSESWLVQRQALKNMNPLWRTLSPVERDRLTASVDLRAKAQWRKSDTELAALAWRANAR